MLETRKIDITEGARKVIASIQTDPGCVREANEDSGRHVSPGDDATRLSKGTLTIVADGMGGHASGEVASQMAMVRPPFGYSLKGRGISPSRFLSG